MGYRLVRTLPDGSVKRSEFVMDTKKQVATQAAQCLSDNTGTSKRDCLEFARVLHDRPIGQTQEHFATGYFFTIEEA